ncbi:uncharacterized protein LOC111319387 [Stylophora pistillata]|nr:uncharacterized protein LOC111319387 [Stylophora pistillata]
MTTSNITQNSPSCDKAQEYHVTEEILVESEVHESNYFEELEPSVYEKALYRLGVRTSDGKDIIFIDTDRLPNKEHFNKNKEGKKNFKQAVRELCGYLEVFILTYVETHNFVIVVHGGSSEKCGIKDGLGKQIYQKLKNGFLDRMAKCIIFKPQKKLKALGLLLSPFLKREMRQRIVMTKSERYLNDIQGIPDFVTKYL